MNRQLFCAVGVASGVFLLASGVAEAAPADEADRNIAPKASDAGAGRTELLPGFFGGKDSADGLADLLKGLPGGPVLRNFMDSDGPLGNLIGGDGPVGSFMAGFSGDSDDDGDRRSRAATVDSPQIEYPGARDDYLMDWRQAVAQEEPVHDTSDGEETRVERRIVAYGKPLVGGLFGPIGRMEILGVDTLRGVPVLGDLLADGLSLNTLSGMPPVTDVVEPVLNQDPGKASPPVLGSLPTVGKLGQTLLGGETASQPTEAAIAPLSNRRALAPRATDKAKVTPSLVTLLGWDAVGTHALNDMIYQLPFVGKAL